MSTDRSTFYNSLLGQSKNKFSFSNHRESKSISDTDFYKWTTNNMYRTSYHDMAKRVRFNIFKIYQCDRFLSYRVNLSKEKTW